MLESSYSEHIALTNPTRIRVIYELVLTHSLKLVDDIVMHNSVTERGGEHLPFYRLVNNETDGW